MWNYLSILAQTAPAAGAAAPGGGGDLSSILFSPMTVIVIGMFGMIYFTTIRPQQRRQKEHLEMLKKLKSGDRVKTAGGIYGTISVVKENSLVLEIAEKVKIEVERGSVVSMLNDNGQADLKN